METWETVSAMTFAAPSLGKSEAQHKGCESLSACSLNYQSQKKI